MLKCVNKPMKQKTHNWLKLVRVIVQKSFVGDVGNDVSAVGLAAGQRGGKAQTGEKLISYGS